MDFAKAFDTVWHNGLFHKLQMKGISGNFLHLIQDMYENTECAVKLNSSRTNYFKCSKGVRQGCPLSPTLFNLYLNDLIDDLNESNTSPLTLGDEPVTCLMYADDIIILSCSHSGLQNCLNTLSEYCNQWKLSINTSKSKCMTFYKRNNIYKNKFFIKGIPLENVTEFTYLGITTDDACSFKDTLRVLSSKATRALFALDSRFKLKNLPINKLLWTKFEKIWNDRISTCSKAITYKTHKTNVEYEKYLSLIKNRKHRRPLTKLRLSDHCLAFEKERHSKPPVIREERFYTSCPNIIED